MLEVESDPQVPTFRNSTYLDPQVGLARDLGARHISYAWGYSYFNQPKYNKGLHVNHSLKQMWHLGLGQMGAFKN